MELPLPAPAQRPEMPKNAAALLRMLLLLVFSHSALKAPCQPILHAGTPLPALQKAVYGKGRFILDHAGVWVSAGMPEEEKLAVNGFIDYVRVQAQLSLAAFSPDQPSPERPGIPLLVIDCDHSGASLPFPGDKAGPQSREWYSIRVSPERITVNARSGAGVFYALQTLRQLMVTEDKGAYIPEVTIEDYPAFAYRGIMIDFAHGGLPTEEEIRRQIDFLSRWKINQYYFYNEVSIEMKGYPLLNYRAQYSQEQIRRIVAYGKERCIDVIPFVNFYGHLHELLRLRKYAGLGIGQYGHDLDPRKPGVQAMLSDWIKQYADLFPGPFMHIGFDETWETVRLSAGDPRIHPEQWYLDHMAFVTQALGQYGKKVMVWTDMSKDHPGIIAKFPKGIVPVVWDYSDNYSSIKEWIKPIAKERLPFFIQPAVDGWAHLYPTETTWANMDLCLKAADEFHALGYISSVWNDAVQPMLRNSWMFMAYGAVLSWQDKPMDRNAFIDAYSQIVYPEVPEQMAAGFKKLAESQVFLRRRLGQTQTRMWINPFLPHNLKETVMHAGDYESAKLAAELAQEFFTDAWQHRTKDSAFIGSLLLNARLLSYTATRFLWAKKINERWDHSMGHYGKKEDSWYGDIGENGHGLLTDIMDYTGELKEEYRQAWLSENMPYRLGTMTGRFDAEYLFWRRLSLKLLDYRDNKTPGDRPVSFWEAFTPE